VLSSWSGIRPLASDPTKAAGDGGGDTASLVREHVIFQDTDGLVTVSWWLIVTLGGSGVIQGRLLDGPGFSKPTSQSQ